MITGDSRLGRVMEGAEGVEPGVQLESTTMRRRHGKLQRIIGRTWRPAHGTRQVFGPGFEFGFVQCVAGWTDLEQDGVQMIILGVVEQGQQFRLLSGDTQTGL